MYVLMALLLCFCPCDLPGQGARAVSLESAREWGSIPAGSGTGSCPTEIGPMSGFSPDRSRRRCPAPAGNPHRDRGGGTLSFSHRPLVRSWGCTRGPMSPCHYLRMKVSRLCPAFPAPDLGGSPVPPLSSGTGPWEHSWSSRACALALQAQGNAVYTYMLGAAVLIHKPAPGAFFSREAWGGAGKRGDGWRSRRVGRIAGLGPGQGGLGSVRQASAGWDRGYGIMPP